MPKKSWLQSTSPDSVRGGFGVERGHAEHLAGALAVTRGDDGGVDVDKALLLEEAVNGGSRDRADAEHGAEQVGART